MTDLAAARTAVPSSTQPCSTSSATRSGPSARRRRCRPSCTRRRGPGVRDRGAVRHDWLCVGRADADPEPGDWFTVDIVGEPIVIVRDKAGDVNGDVGGLPAPGDAGVRGHGQLHDVQVPVPPLELRPRRPPARRAGDGAHDRLRQGGVRAAAAAGRAVAGLRVRQLRPRRRAARADARALQPYLANFDLDDAVCTGTFTLTRPAVELEGDVRELQRRLPRQPAPPVRPGLLPELR